jgi:outer membrane receptor for ferrienterochelin and colicins
MKVLRILFLVLISSNFLFSQEDSSKVYSKLEELTLEELLNLKVYSASKKIELLKDAPAIISILNAQDIQKTGAISLIDVLKYIPGVETSMGSDGNYRLALRGSRKEGNILVLINGQQINDFYSGRAIYDLPVDFIERVEVVRGPGSALFGTNALVGVINVITVEKTAVNFSVGPDGNINANANLFLEKDDSQFALSMGYIQNNTNQNEIDSDKLQNLNWSLTNGEKKFKTNRWNKDLFLNSKFDKGNFHFQLFNIYRQNGAYVGPTFIAAPDSDFKRNQLSSMIHYNFKISDNVVITPKLYYQLNYNNLLQQEAPDNYLSNTSGNIFTNGKLSHEEYLNSTIGGEITIYIKASDKIDFLTGSVYEDLRMNSYNLERNYQITGDLYKGTFGNYDNIPFDQNGKNRIVFAYYMQTNYKHEKWNITAGLRYDDYSDFGQSLNPRIGVTYKVNTNFSLKALAGKAFRAPTFLELYDNTTLGNEYGVKGNVNLDNESIITYELGSELYLNNIVLKYNVYHILNTNLIRVYDTHGSGGIGVYNNIGNNTITGHAVELIWKISPKINFSTNFSHYLNRFEWNEENVNQADLVFFEKQAYYNKELRNIPTMRINSTLSFKHKKFFLFVGGNFGNPSENNKRFFLEKNHYAVIPFYLQGNFNVAYQVSKKILVSISGNNIGTKYSDPDESTNINAFGEFGLIQPRAMYLLNLKYDF